MHVIFWRIMLVIIFLPKAKILSLVINKAKWTVLAWLKNFSCVSKSQKFETKEFYYTTMRASSLLFHTQIFLGYVLDLWLNKNKIFGSVSNLLGYKCEILGLDRPRISKTLNRPTMFWTKLYEYKTKTTLTTYNTH